MADKKLKQVEIFRTEIDFSKLDEWRDSTKDDLPVCGYMSFYRAIGLLDAAKKYNETHPDFYLYHLDSILCNYMTNKAIRRFIEKNWSIYDIDIKEDNNVFWNTRKFPKGTRHYEKRIRERIKQCLAKDFSKFTPGLDDELGVNEIVLVDWVEDTSSDDSVVDVESVDKN